MKKVIVSPSILSADFNNLKRELQLMESSGAEWINMSIPLLAASFAYVKEFGKTKSIPEAIDIILNGNLKSMDEMFRKCPDAYKLFLISVASSMIANGL